MLHLILATVVFYALHSALADAAVKRWAKEKLGLERWYRLCYTLISIILLGWVLLTYLRVPGLPLWEPGPVLLVLARTMMLLGSALSVTVVMRFGSAGFIGFVPENQGALVRTGLHGRVRHPIYSGIMLAMLGWLLWLPNATTLAVVVITVVYLPIGIALEERKLIALYGGQYQRYREEVPALFPKIRPRSRTSAGEQDHQ